ncbi:hypothetical protein DPSP01_009041 [Paraphaeosphaeria sporulosa]|uniref:Zn(2)-C6 fungal-type domain-containing protein n=1 Tax=Paraphaeosphaeria sporulosa TaxID=1460663 RepID=A0A177C8C3_9PLEO|nr:uncharacterized protein CC84DRAFT_1206771 [Paraphaeosphaeria sporulosa]OAG03381.1 hypothetical protein CC84DRAFT_1206771 [Paraphaeosphaeria sporulosa]
MSDALPTPSEPADSPEGSDGVARRPSPEEGSARGAENKAIKRRAHRKSRFGCKNCKLRRIKCDERKPECLNCRNRQVRCDYLPSSQAAVTTAAPSPAEAVVAPSLFGALNVEDLELMYHWTTSTSATLSSQTSGAIFWRTQVTELALSHHHILHLILSITASHLARFRPQRRDEYVALADHHYATALPVVTAELSHLHQDNCDPVLLSVQLICTFTWARGPQPGEYLAFGEKGRSDWLVMFRGIRTTLETVGYDNFTRSMAPNIRAHAKPLPNVAGTLAYEEPLAELSDYIQYASKPAQLSQNVYAHQVLLECYSNRYGGVDGEYHIVFAWLFRMHEEFLEALQRHQTVPLVIYAHFAVLMNDMESFWYMKGWTTHVLAGIWNILRDEDRVHIRWPVSVVGWIPP